MDSINIFLLSAKGLNIPEKRRMLLNNIKRSHADVAFIQETHFRADRPPCRRNQFYPWAYHATNTIAKSKGVFILLSGKLPLKCEDTLIDREGRYVFLEGSIGDTQVTLAIANVYSPNDRQDVFLH